MSFADPSVAGDPRRSQEIPGDIQEISRLSSVDDSCRTQQCTSFSLKGESPLAPKLLQSTCMQATGTLYDIQYTVGRKLLTAALV
jgi:hypothetical protein